MKKQIVLALVLVNSLSLSAFGKSGDKKVVELSVTEKGFDPKSIDIKAGSDVTLNVTRKTDDTCAKQIQIPSKDLKVDLPLNKPVKVALGKVDKGEVRFACGMDSMETGLIIAK